MANRLRELIVAFAEAGTEFVVAGGVACVLQGVERVTLDLDIALRFTPSSVAAFLRVTRDRGMVPRAPVPPETLADACARQAIVEQKHALVFTFVHPDDPFAQVDVFLAESLAYERLVVESVSVDVGGHAVRVLSRRQLLALKQAIVPPRPKDVFDIAELSRLLRTETL